MIERVEVGRRVVAETRYGAVRARHVVVEYQRLYRDVDGHVIADVPVVESYVLLELGRRTLRLSADDFCCLDLALSALRRNCELEIARAMAAVRGPKSPAECGVRA